MPITRLELAQMRADLAEYLGPRVARLKYLGELFKCVGHAPGVLLSFMHLTDALKEALPDRVTEVAVLTTATLMSNPYERNQHERLCIRLGLSPEWIEAAESLQPDHAPHLSDTDRVVQRFVIAAVRTNGLKSQAEFEAVIPLLGQDQAVALLMLVGRYITHAIAVNTLALAPPVPSIFEDGFRGDGAAAKDQRGGKA
jgi:alkylhydroperoxidase family enzyme